MSYSLSVCLSGCTQGVGRLNVLISTSPSYNFMYASAWPYTRDGLASQVRESHVVKLRASCLTVQAPPRPPTEVGGRETVQWAVLMTGCRVMIKWVVAVVLDHRTDGMEGVAKRRGWGDSTWSISVTKALRCVYSWPL